jgi:ankyrin repeat protein
MGLTRFPSLEKNLSLPPDGWSESDVPLAQRGVRVSWLISLVQGLINDINQSRVQAIADAENDQPGREVSVVHDYALLNVRSLVKHFIVPLTVTLRAPLWALLPSEHRGKPDFFLSHTWSSLLLGPPHQPIGTLDTIEHLNGFAWLDFVAYNQHSIKSIPSEMEGVIGEIGKVMFAGTPVPTLGRIWCLWELLCANRTGTDFDIAIKPGFRNDKILAVNTLYRSFIGVEKAVATKKEDQDIITSEVLSQFGSPKAANDHLEQALHERLSGSWYELREKDQHLGFRPWPWMLEQSPEGQELAKRPFRERADPYYGAGIRNTVIYGSEQTTFDSLIEAGLIVNTEELADYQLRNTPEAVQDLVNAVLEGNFKEVQSLLEGGTDPNRPVVFGSALGHAAQEGHIEIIKLLLDWGADIEGGTSLSPLTCAAYKGHDDAVRLLIERGANKEADIGQAGTALFQASSKGHLSTVRLLLEHDADVNAKTEKRATPLLIATAGGHLNVVVHLIEAGADLECTDRSGDTALHHAADKGFDEIVNVLIKAGANRAAVDKYGDTPYSLGRSTKKLDASTLELLKL